MPPAFQRSYTTIVNIFMGAAIYLTPPSTIDHETRRMVKALFGEVSGKLLTAMG